METEGTRRRTAHISVADSSTPQQDAQIQPAFPDSEPRKDGRSHVSDITFSKPRLLRFSDLPHWLQDNHYILAHYRPVSNSYVSSFVSLFYLHNESVNIYTHLLGAFASILIGIGLHYAYFSVYPTASLTDGLACSCFFFGAALCLGMSATFHSINCHSERVCRFGNALDYLGIVSLISGSFVPMVYYGFFCERGLQIFYWSLVSTLLPEPNPLRLYSSHLLPVGD